MNYRKLINKRLSDFPGQSGDKSAAVIGLLAGLAVGAVLGVLFAPESGRKTRERISDKALDLADNVKDGFHSIKDTVSNGRDSLIGLKDQVVGVVKDKANEVAQDYKDFRESELSKSRPAGEAPDYVASEN
ncbi:MAG: YtxH domain-containing protein [Bacteroidota bacterium]